MLSLCATERAYLSQQFLKAWFLVYYFPGATKLARKQGKESWVEQQSIGSYNIRLSEPARAFSSTHYQENLLRLLDLHSSIVCIQ